MSMKVLILPLLVAVLFDNHRNAVVQALPSGVPVCSVGVTAVQNQHLNRPNTVTGSIAFGSFAVQIGNTALNSSTVNTIVANTDLPLVLSSVNNTQFRGVAIILNHPNASLISNLFINPNSTEYKTAIGCENEPVSSICHTDNSLKNSAEATINLPNNRAAFLDVNIVVVARGSNSTYFYTRFQLMTDPSPTKPPTRTPTKSPTKAPSNTKAPTKAPSNTKAPTKAPSIPPANAPTGNDCGLFGLNLLCFNGCGLFGRIFGLCK